jgi:hypothetical protein
MAGRGRETPLRGDAPARGTLCGGEADDGDAADCCPCSLLGLIIMGWAAAAPPAESSCTWLPSRQGDAVEGPSGWALLAATGLGKN